MKVNKVYDTVYKVDGVTSANIGRINNEYIILKNKNGYFKVAIFEEEKYSNSVEKISREEVLKLLPNLE